MRERLWLLLRQSSAVRWLYGLPGFARPMQIAAGLLVPFSSRTRVRVQAGPARGLQLELDPRWEHHAWDGSYEPEALAEFLALVKRGLSVFDIGGGIGFYALVAARAGANVIAFEPDPGNAESLIEYAVINNLSERIRIVHQAVFSHTGRVILVRSDGISSHHNASVQAGGADQARGAAFEVPCTTLDDFIGHDVGPALIKIDVEGAESDVLRGANQLFRMHRPHVLCEVHDDTNAAFVQSWLNEQRYSFRWIEVEPAFPRHLLAWPRSD
jgi:FkbM family methyltransferase